MDNSNYKQHITRAAITLKEAGVESYMIDARLLFCFCLKISLEKLIGYPENIVNDTESKNFFNCINRRANKEPISHIIGIREFRGLDFKVTPATLDPRADSETLIDFVHEYYPDKNKNLNIIDLGTGSGCLLLSLLHEFPNAKGTGVDISRDALEIATLNAKNLELANRVNFVLNSWISGINEKFDIIISNPPYIKTCEIANLQPEVAIYEPKSALDGGESGLGCYVEIAKEINSIAYNDSMAFFEFGIGQELDVKNTFSNSGFKFVDFKKDLAGITRCLSLIKK